jgi:adenosylmethionine-8-amino-7-oxononanoate aminotransferase
MTHVMHRDLRTVPELAVSGRGIEIIDARGKHYIDASGGAAVSCLGHQHPDVVAAMHAQLDKLAYAHTGFFTTEVAEALADRLVRDAPEKLDHVYLVSGGSEAMEAALKLARQYFVEIGQSERNMFIARRQSYHGNTLGALAVGGNEWRRRQFAPLLIDVTHVTPCFEYRERAPTETQDQFTDRLIAGLDAAIEQVGPERIIAFCAETVVGATSGAVPPTPSYFRRVRELLDRHGILLISDEVMCGMGRTGTLYAIEQEGVVPDLVAIAKGLGGGYQPIGAVLAHQRVVEPLVRGSGVFQHGHTYIGHAMAAAAALAVQEVIARDRLLDAVRARGGQLMRSLHAALDGHPNVGDIRGRGLFVGVEFVEDRASKRPFAPARRVHARVKAAAMDEGLMVYPMGGTIDGARGDHALIAPPFIVTETQVDEIVHRFTRAVDRAITAAHSA